MALNVFFLRVSTSSQQLESQFDELWNYYSKSDNINRDSIRIIQYKESGVKLSEEDRLGITELKNLVDLDGVDTIYVSELSRIARTEKVLWSFVDYLERHKIQLKCKNPEFILLNDSRTGISFNSRLMVSTFGTLATQEAIEKKERFARGKARKAQEGKYNGGAIPYGYRIDKSNNNLIVIDEGGEANIVREIFNLYESGLSQVKIAKELYNRGIKGRSARGSNLFTISLVHQILTNKLLTGVSSRSKGASYERTYPMIITPEQFERCRNIAKSNNTVAPKATKVYYAHRLIQCVNCGHYFVSAGSKGYYRCWDAYYSYWDVNGNDGITQCTNKICISTNVMDSLLWELSQELETDFIISSANEKAKEYKRLKSIVEDKIKALPSLRKSIDDRMETLFDAYAEGMKKEKFQIRKKHLIDEQKELELNEAQYKEELARYNSLIAETEKNMEINLDYQTMDEIDAYLTYQEAVYKKVSSITNDEERSNIIHKHIKKITIEYTTVNYSFKKYPNGKDVAAKRILIYTYRYENPREFFFIPNNGKGGIILTKYQLPNDTTTRYKPYYVKYLNRITDKYKLRRREAERAKVKENIASGISLLTSQGYISISDMMNISKLSYSTLYNAIKDGKMSGKHQYKTWFVLDKDFKDYLHAYNPKPRKTGKKKLLELLKI